MNVVAKISHKDLVVSKTLPIFAVRTSLHCDQSGTYNNRLGGSPLAPLLRRRGLFAKHIGGSSFFVPSYITNLPKMRTSANLKADARGASASTVNARKRVTSTCAKVAQKQSKAKKDLEVTQKLPTFVVPRTAKSSDQADLHTTIADKAGFPYDNSSSEDLRFLAELGSSASFCAQTPSNNFFQKMPRTEKVSTTGTKCARTARKSAKKTVVSTCAKVAPQLFQITMDLVASHTDETGYCRRCGIIHNDLYEARNEDEALGLAVATVRRKYGSFHDIDIRSIKRERRYNLTTTAKN